ncbi:GNAT family N-acetyltransferase [Pectobacterium carotovorum]|uniref:GNAT family N-acetyltransferase n=1 Tax=Pectobacterium carotovorum TaxID=554 RepID=UPI001CFAC9A8|nr:GNAT family N-acetyltransferase [Pectobacterium carotovorum]UCZ80477.1 GNAT family N-acetyltransferase [Pectobacterium carotovorum]
MKARKITSENYQDPHHFDSEIEEEKGHDFNGVYVWKKSRFHISTDKKELNTTFIHAFLTQSHWAKGIDKNTVEMSVQNSICFGIYRNKASNRQIGFARIITDHCTFAYLSDVFITDEYRGHGLGNWLVQCCLAHPVMAGLRRVMLYTSRAPWLYEKAGFQPINQSDVVWTISRPDVYQQASDVSHVVKLLH